MEFWHVVELLGLGLLGVLSWIAKQQVRRLDLLETRVNEQMVLKKDLDEVKQTVINVDNKMTAQHNAVTSRLDQLLLRMLEDK